MKPVFLKYDKNSLIDFDLSELYDIYWKYIDPQFSLKELKKILTYDVGKNKKTCIFFISILNLLLFDQVFGLKESINILLLSLSFQIFILLPSIMWSVSAIWTWMLKSEFLDKEIFRKNYLCGSSAFLLVKEDFSNEIIGYVGIRTLEQSEISSNEKLCGIKFGHSGEIQRLVLKPKFQGKGIGSKLLNHIELIATENGFEMLTLDARYPEILIMNSIKGKASLDLKV